eukprot:1612282-Lingulodinium_polyedra.AAC.1
MLETVENESLVVKSPNLDASHVRRPTVEVLQAAKSGRAKLNLLLRTSVITTAGDVTSVIDKQAMYALE